ncbi:MAG: helix-turn-helix transcriptional regulator [Ruminococcaceae bacterium]|nr:helix-turn-helix transcriptional regulator [Oscillospiraceae bacterium]
MNHYQRLKDIREDRDLNQQLVADLLGIKQTNYSRYELGKQKMGIDKYIILAKYYNVSIDYLAGVVDTPKTLDGKPYVIGKSKKAD